MTREQGLKLKKRNAELKKENAELRQYIEKREKVNLREEIFLIIVKDFDPLDLKNPIKEYAVTYVKLESMAKKIIEQGNKGSHRFLFENREYPQYYYIKVEEYYRPHDKVEW